jgi:hypothetical protein
LLFSDSIMTLGQPYDLGDLSPGRQTTCLHLTEGRSITN